VPWRRHPCALEFVLNCDFKDVWQLSLVGLTPVPSTTQGRDLNMKPFGMLCDDESRCVSIPRFDLSIFIEKSIPFPVLHRSIQSLRAVNAVSGLSDEPLSGGSNTDAIRVVGDYCGNRELHIDSVWVRAKSSRYRKALQRRNLTANLIDSRLPSTIHADHVVSRASLRVMDSRGHDPWVLMFEVPASANTNFGSKIERHLPKVSPNSGQLHLLPAHIFKLYMTEWPRSRAEFDAVLDNISRQIRNDGVVSQIRQDFAPLFS
jgi:hypothetical protein